MLANQTGPATPRASPGAWLVRHLIVVVLGLLLVGACTVALASSVWAYLSTTGGGAGSGTTTTLLAPTNPVATATTNSGTVPVSWTASTLGTGQPVQGYYVLRVRLSDQLIAAACETTASNLLTTTSCNDTTVPDGSYRYQVVAVHGSWAAHSVLSNAVTVVNDSTLPTVTVTATTPTPNNNGYTSTSPVTVSLSATPGSGGSLILSLTYWVDSAAPTTVLGDRATVHVSGNGTHLVSFYGTNLAGRRSVTGTHTVRIDTLAPAAPSAPRLTWASDTGASATDGITNITAPTFTGTAEAGSAVGLYDGSTLIGSGTATAGTYTITTSALTPAAQGITAKATDLAGNTSAFSASTSIVIDTTAPPVPSTPALAAPSDSGRSSSDEVTNIVTPTFTGTTETNATVTLFDGALTVGSGTAPSSTWAVATTALSNGAHTITATATDLAGNPSPASAGATITIDTLPPSPPSKPLLTAASDTGLSSTDAITKATAPTFTGTTERRSIVTLSDNGTALVMTEAVSSGNYSVTSTALTDGSHPITTTATDIAGNVSLPSSTSTVLVDTLAPVASAPTLTVGSDTGISSTDKITKVTTPTLTGTSESGASVVLLDGATQVGTGTAADGSYTISTKTTLTAGNHNLTARSTDLAGNAGAASSITTITIDTTAPTVTVNQAASQADPATTSPVHFTAAFSEAVYGFSSSEVTLSGTAQATTVTITGTGPAYTLMISGMTTTGTVTATIPAAQVTDAAGNTNTAASSTDNSITYTGPTGP